MKKYYVAPEMEEVVAETVNPLAASLDLVGDEESKITQDKDILSREFEFVFE